MLIKWSSAHKKQEYFSFLYSSNIFYFIYFSFILIASFVEFLPWVKYYCYYTPTSFRMLLITSLRSEINVENDNVYHLNLLLCCWDKLYVWKSNSNFYFVVILNLSKQWKDIRRADLIFIFFSGVQKLNAYTSDYTCIQWQI